MNHDVAVVGSGIVGSAIVWQLARAGHRVAWITGGDAESATSASGAMLAVHSEVTAHQSAATVELEVATRLVGQLKWREWLDELAIPARRGMHVVASTEDDLANLTAIRNAVAGGPFSVENLAPLDVPGLFPDASGQTVEAIYLADEATVDSSLVLAALRSSIASITTVTVVDDRAETVSASGVTLTSGVLVSADSVVLATGIETGRILQSSNLADVLPLVFGGRGLSMLVRGVEPLAGGVRTPNRAFACGLHMLPRADGLTYLGATNRLTTQPEPTATPQLSELHDLISGGAQFLDHRLRRAEVVRMAVGHRPVTVDRIPLVGRTSEDWLLVATATWRNGVVLAPLIATLIEGELADPGSNINHPFAPTREVREQVLDAATIARAARGIADGMEPTAPGRAGELAATIAATLTQTIDGGDRTVARLLKRAPMEEALPLVHELIVRQRR